MKVLYVSDLDGTLITRNERISEYSLGILNALIGRGLLFTYGNGEVARLGRTRRCGAQTYASRRHLQRGVDSRSRFPRAFVFRFFREKR